MTRVINPVALIKQYLNEQGFKQSVKNEDEYKDLHHGIIKGAAILLNDLNGIQEGFCWDQDYGKDSVIAVILEAIKKVERDLDCFSIEDSPNKDLLLEKQRGLLEQEEKMGHLPHII